MSVWFEVWGVVHAGPKHFCFARQIFEWPFFWSFTTKISIYPGKFPNFDLFKTFTLTFLTLWHEQLYFLWKITALEHISSIWISCNPHSKIWGLWHLTPQDWSLWSALRKSLIYLLESYNWKWNIIFWKYIRLICSFVWLIGAVFVSVYLNMLWIQVSKLWKRMTSRNSSCWNKYVSYYFVIICLFCFDLI